MGEQVDDAEPMEKGETPSKRRRESSSEDTPSKKKTRVEKASQPSGASQDSASTSSTPTVSEARLKQFMALLQRCISEKNMAESLEIHVVRTFFAKVEKKEPFTEGEIDAVSTRWP